MSCRFFIGSYVFSPSWSSVKWTWTRGQFQLCVNNPNSTKVLSIWSNFLLEVHVILIRCWIGMEFVMWFWGGFLNPSKAIIGSNETLKEKRWKLIVIIVHQVHSTKPKITIQKGRAHTWISCYEIVYLLANDKATKDNTTHNLHPQAPPHPILARESPINNPQWSNM